MDGDGSPVEGDGSPAQENRPLSRENRPQINFMQHLVSFFTLIYRKAIWVSYNTVREEGVR